MAAEEMITSAVMIFVLVLASATEAPARELVRELEVSEKVPKGTLVGFIGDDGTSGDGGPPYLIVTHPGSGVDTDLSVEENTGEIRTRVELDRETRDSYSLLAIPQNGENVRITVRVLDENDNAPTFPSPYMHIEFPENTPRDVKRTLHPARDLDLGIYNTQRYNIVSGNVNNAFRLSSHRERDGVLYLDLQINGFLDRETTASYGLLIEALDGGTPPLRGAMTVNITIQDVNDNQPIFNQSRYFAMVPENATVGTSVLQVFATDSDAGKNGQVQYSINRRQSDREGMFRIDPGTGLIVVNRPLDFETKEVHELAVVARDNGIQPLETTAFISVRVTDVNDNQPTINVIFLSDDATPKISESAQPGEFVARISVNDPDSKTEYSNVSVTLEGGEGHFGLATRDSIIYLVIVALPIDRESKPNYTLSVIATDTGSPPLHASRTFHLRVTDVNDNAPEFDESEYEADVLEVAEPGTSVYQVTAKDRDEGDNSILSYSLVGTPSSYSGWFQIDARSGLITTRSHIDCETASEPKLTVRAVDSGSPPLSSEATVKITIHDVNDNEPIFLQTFYNTSVREDAASGHCFLKVTANDSDCGVNAKVNYTLGEGSRQPKEFEVRPDSGEICVVSGLDYERRSSYEFPVVASDRGGLRTTAIVKVLLTDVNDNRPVFYPSKYNVSLSDDGRGGHGFSSPIVVVVASDLDSGKFGTVTYRMVSGNEGNLFRIDRNTGEIFLVQPNSLSPRSQNRYKLNVTAVDGAGLKSENDAVVYISVTDSSRGPPFFEQSKYKFKVREDAQRDTVVGIVKATHGASSDSVDPIQYYINSGDPEGTFSIDADTGTIRISSFLDRESRSSVLLNVQAMSGDPPGYGHTQVNIVIEDVNDNPPEFGSSSVRISVPEDVDPGFPLYQAHATDRDSGQNGVVRYRLDAGKDSDGLFSVDPVLGHLTLTRRLDYETAQRHLLVISATDSGIPKLSSNLTLIVEVQDVNDNPPVFERSEYTVNVPESLPINSQVLQVTAVDHDTGNNARLTYRIKSANRSENVDSLFGMFPNSGSIYLKRQLDREEKSRYALVVSATDNGTPADTATARIVINVLDANDNDPKFTKESYEFAVEENSPVNSFVGKVSAEDPDANANAVVRYSFVPGNSTFRINPVTGDIFTKEFLDRETKAVYELVAEARDQGVPPRSSRIPVRVAITDVNDNAPEHVDPQEDVVSVREEQPPGTEVTRVKAIDRDEGNNATITYSILKSRDSDGYGIFSVDPLSGSIRTRTVLDHEERSIYRLAVAATDGGKPSQQTVRILRVEVLDISDHRPTFTSSSLLFKVREDAGIGYVVGNVAPLSDSAGVASGENAGFVRYTVTSVSARNPYHGAESASPDRSPNHNNRRPGGGAFEIEKQGGNLVISGELDREKQSEYVLEVRALDTTSSNNPQSSAVTIRVEVTDVNDHSPEWPSNPIVIRLPEDTPVGTVVSNYSATDADASSNADLRYALAGAYPKSGAGAFSVDALTGIITLNAPLDFEDLTEYTLIVRATDQAVNVTERHSTSVAFLIAVLDSNDNEPHFISPTTTFVTVSDATPIGSVVAKFLAVDMDSEENGRVTYAISGGGSGSSDDSPRPFSLDRETGYLTLTGFAFPDGAARGSESYVVNVTASDQGNPPMRKQFSLRVFVRRSTEIPPKFTRALYSVSLPEDVAPETVVATVEARTPNNAENNNGTKRNMSYRIPRGIAEDKFAVDPRDGTVTIKSPLDRETQDHYSIPVYVSDEDGKHHYDTALLVVKVLDVNDHAPEFKTGSCYPIHVPENSDLSVIHKMVASDLDSGANGEITYSISSGNVGNKFSIDLHSGLLSARPLDREVHSRYTLVVTAQDRGNPRSLQGSCNVTIYVSDENDNDPKFSQKKYEASIPEDTPPDTDVLVVEATDADVGVNSKIVYSLANESHWLFKIDNRTGIISTTGWFDRERRSRYEFQVVATDGGKYDARSRRVPVSIVITDVNDNKPVFSSCPFSVHVPTYKQAGTNLLKVVATDADEGANAELVYSFVNEPANNKFRINPTTGVITSSASLTGESGRMFHLEVLARDRGNPPLTGTGLVEIRVGAEADAPTLRFQNATYNVRIAENLPSGREIAQVSAVRTDGRRQKIRYSFGSLSHENAFDIDSDTGWIRVRDGSKLDYEAFGEMVLPIVAEGEGPLYGYSEIRVKLTDENDNPPRFTQEHYSASVWEGNNKGTFVIQVSACDLDEGSNARVLYHIVDGNHDNAFAIEPPFSGLVKTNIVLDREIRDTYRLTIIATDEGSPQLTGTSTLRINIVDANDNQPTFPPHSIVSVSEGTEVGTVLTAVTANDVDTNPTLTYSFTDDDDDDDGDSSAFSIDRFSGKIILDKKLDYETKKEYRLGVTASDTAHTAHTYLIIRVSDINDNAPSFWQPAYQAVLPDGSDPTYPLLTLNASDRDSGSNAKISYSILIPTRGISIDSNSGALFANRSSLSSALQLASEGANDIEVAVAATDMGKPQLRSVASVRIRVNGDRDFLPHFTQEEYQIRVREDGKKGVGILKVANAANEDGEEEEEEEEEAPNSEFFITAGNDDGVFQILSPRGELVLLKKLDREKKNSYSLHVTSGSGGTYKSNNATVHVSVDDANDNAPRFQGAGDCNCYEVLLPESARIGTSVIALFANDSDLVGSPNTELSYEIVSGNDEDLFSIESKSGEIRVKRALDYDVGAKSYNLVVRVSDGAKPPDRPLSSLANVRIHLEDDNDNAPVFPVAEYLEFVAENEPAGTSIFTAGAVDRDKGLYGKLNYSISASDLSDPEDSWKLFKVDANTGIVSSNAAFDYETRNRYLFTLRAVDVGGMTSKVRVRIEIESRDEFAPQFTDRTYRFAIPPPSTTASPDVVGVGVVSAVPVGCVVGSVEATDRDKGPDGRVVYQLTTQQTHFKINRTTGAIVVKKKLTGNAIDSGTDITFVVTASSGRQGSLTNTTVVEIAIDPLAVRGGIEADVGGGGGGGGGSGSGSSDGSDATVTSAAGLADWALGLLIALILTVIIFGGIFLFLHVRNRRQKKVNKSALNAGGINGNADGFVDPGAFDTIPIRGSGGGGGGGGVGLGGGGGVGLGVGGGLQGAAAQFAPPKYDEIPPYGSGHRNTSSSGNATTSELSGSEQSGSSGRGSAEDGEDVEDEEIRMINEGPLQRDGGVGVGVGVGGIHMQNMDEDNMSDVSVHNTQEYLARLGIVDNSTVVGVGVGAVSSSRRSSETLAAAAAAAAVAAAAAAAAAAANKDILHQGIHQMPTTMDSLRMFAACDEEGGGGGSSGGGGGGRGSGGGGDVDVDGETDISNLIYAKLNDVSVERGGSSENVSSVNRSVILSGFDPVPGVNGIGTQQQPSMIGSLSSIVHSEEELTGSYNWDYLLDWGPQYQPLAHVFSEIARLKDDTASVQSTNSGSASSKGGKGAITTPKSLPPPLLTSVAPRSIAAPVITPRGPGLTSHHASTPHHSAQQQQHQQQHHQQQHHQLLLLPRSPISHDATGAGFSTSSAMSPSFSPSLSPLSTRSPSISPLVTPGMSTSHHVVSMPRQNQRSTVTEAELRI